MLILGFDSTSLLVLFVLSDLIQFNPLNEVMNCALVDYVCKITLYFLTRVSCIFHIYAIFLLL